MPSESRRLNQLRKIAADIQKREEIDSSLRRARDEQLHMLPAIPEIHGYDIASAYVPAGEIGGDFYDFVSAGKNKWNIIIGDVTGHGIEAAIIMGMAKKTMSICSRGASDPVEILSKANLELHGDLLPTRFVSAGLLILDVEKHHVQFARAGHNPLIIFNPKRRDSFRELSPGGTVLGIIKTEMFAKHLEIEDFPIYAGDFILLYTDGITEVRNDDGKEYGVDGLREVLENNIGASTQKILDKMIDGARKFGDRHEFEDDVTLLAIRVKG